MSMGGGDILLARYGPTLKLGGIRRDAVLFHATGILGKLNYVH